ncbi:endothelial cell adhesion molecule a isoform 1-T1 [Aplochiton taeniatus]
MEIYTSRKLNTLLSLAFLWGLSGVLSQIQTPQENMEVIQGQRVVLQAGYTPTPGVDLSQSTVLWNFMANTTKLIIAYTKTTVYPEDSPFLGRVDFAVAMPSSVVSLYINNTQESDSGRYLCQVIRSGAPPLTWELTLNVKVPPAVPVCSLSGKPVLKGNVTLNCHSKSGKPIPVYKWKKTSPVSEVFFSPMLNEKTGTLKLNNLSGNMSGKFVCSASNTAGSESCYINLEVITSTNAGVIAGATVGSVLGLVFIVLFIIFLLKRRRDTEEDLANDIKEDAQAPKRVSWAKSGTGSDIISKNGTLSSITSSPHQRDPTNHHHHHHYNNHHHMQQYPQRPPSDTASIITATGSMAGYRPRQHGSSTPNQGYVYDSSITAPRSQPTNSTEARANGSPLPRTERATPLPQAQPLPQTYSQPAATRPPLLPTSVVTASNISRMGGVPIMVPAQNQAGSLV